MEWAKKLYGNCDLRIDMGTTDVLTAQFFCDLTGVSTVETTAIRKSASLEGQLTEYGQANISSIQRNLLNKDEILRMPSSKLLGILRGNQAFMLDKVIYKEHPNAKKLKDSPITEYKPNISKNNLSKSKSTKTIKNSPMNSIQNEFDNF